MISEFQIYTQNVIDYIDHLVNPTNGIGGLPPQPSGPQYASIAQQARRNPSSFLPRLTLADGCVPNAEEIEKFKRTLLSPAYITTESAWELSLTPSDGSLIALKRKAIDPKAAPEVKLVQVTFSAMPEFPLIKEIAMYKVRGVPVIFEARDRCLEDNFVEHLASWMTACYREWPSLVDMIYPEQLDFLLIVSDLSFTRFSELQTLLMSEMRRYTTRSQFQIHQLSSATDDLVQQYRFTKWELDSSKGDPADGAASWFWYADPIIRDTTPHPVPAMPYIVPMLQRALAISQHAFQKQWIRSQQVISMIDIGQVPSTMALRSAISGGYKQGIGVFRFPGEDLLGYDPPLGGTARGTEDRNL
jgi:hypothetical protein